MIRLSTVKKFFTEITAAQPNRIINDIDFDDDICYDDIDFDDDICYDRDDLYSRSDRASKRKIKTANKPF